MTSPPGGAPSKSDARRRGLRADARRNRQRVLLAAREVLLEHGADAPLDEVARHAGVGIATLYRRFPDRESLLRGVALDVLARAAEAACRAEAEEADPFVALGRYMHRALDLRISAVMPALLGRISFEDDDVRRARQDTVEPVSRMIEAAQAAGRLRSDVGFGDIGLLLVRLSQPLPGPFPRDVDLLLAHRHLDLLLAALEVPSGARPAPLSGPVMTLDRLRSLRVANPNGQPVVAANQ
ncbi:MAG TPA: TetR/AcrR family transcriptional regulator [Chloroflexota bacterium]